jgi:RNA-binding protein
MNDSIPTPATLSGAEIRKLRSRAQLLEAVTRLGKGGVSPEFLAGLDRELTAHELVKVRLSELKDQRHEVGERLARETGSHLVTVIGHVVVLYRAKPAATPAA